MTRRYLIISGVLLLILTIGITFAFLTTSITGTNATAAKIENGLLSGTPAALITADEVAFA